MVNKAGKPSVMKHGEQSWLTFQTEMMMQQERRHAKTILTNGPNLARGPGFEHP